MNNNKITHTNIIPLIGGLPIGQSQVFESKLEYILSYSGFINNDRHQLNYWPDVPYYKIDEDKFEPHYVDVVGATCPCAGLSMLVPHQHRSEELSSKHNDHLLDSLTTDYVKQSLKNNKLEYTKNSLEEFLTDE